MRKQWIAMVVAGTIGASLVAGLLAREEPVDPGDASAPAPATTLSPGAVAPAHAPAVEDAEARPTDPDELAAWFEQRVLQGLDEGPAGGVREVSAQGSDPRSALRAALGRDDRDVDWGYVDDVFSGRVSGIPDVRRAGVTLQELDRIGDVPYLERLRAEQRYDELRELGFENENAPWPSCIRSGTCRRDRGSSPPG